MKYKLFISDYDGTLGVAPKNNIDHETLDAINKFIAKGGVFVVCSGRETTSITRILKEQNLKGVVVSFQGAKISEIESGKVILDAGLTMEKALEVLDACEKYCLTPVHYGEEDFCYPEFNPYVDYYTKAVRLKGRIADVKEEIKRAGKNVLKIGWLGPDDVVNCAANELNQIFKGNGVLFNSGAPCLLEAINPEYGKGNAVRFLSKYYGVPFEKIITVGDSTNDIGLVRGEWHGVAVGDAKEELKAVAKEIAVPFAQKPVKYLLEKYCL